jgi:hypothetical protein
MKLDGTKTTINSMKLFQVQGMYSVKLHGNKIINDE